MLGVSLSLVACELEGMNQTRLDNVADQGSLFEDEKPSCPT